jgi:hypothetical protein
MGAQRDVSSPPPRGGIKKSTLIPAFKVSLKTFFILNTLKASSIMFLSVNNFLRKFSVGGGGGGGGGGAGGGGWRGRRRSGGGSV